MIPRKNVVFTHDVNIGQHTAKVSYYATLHEPPCKGDMIAGPSMSDIEEELYQQLVHAIFGGLRKELGELQMLTEKRCYESSLYPIGDMMKLAESEKAQREQFNKIMEMLRGF